MRWEGLLSQEDERFFRESISLLEGSVLERFRHHQENPAVLAAIRWVPRHLFVNAAYRTLAYTDNALPTSGGLTTSAPSVIAEMLYHSGARRGQRVLEIGTGTGYQAAVLAEMGVRLFSVEIDRAVATRAARILARLGYKAPEPASGERSARQGSVRLYWGNGQGGIPEHAPFDAVIVSASVSRLEDVREPAAQLSPRGGRLVVPVGSRYEQQLTVMERRGAAFSAWAVPGMGVNFLRLVRRRSGQSDPG